MTVLGTLAVAVVTTVASFAGALLSALVNRKTARERDRVRRREEAFRTLRWAVEQAGMPEVHLKSAALAVLDHLISSDLLETEDQAMVAAVAETVIHGVTADAVAEALGETYPGNRKGDSDDQENV